MNLSELVPSLENLIPEVIGIILISPIVAILSNWIYRKVYIKRPIVQLIGSSLNSDNLEILANYHIYKNDPIGSGENFGLAIAWLLTFLRPLVEPNNIKLSTDNSFSYGGCRIILGFQHPEAEAIMRTHPGCPVRIKDSMIVLEDNLWEESFPLRESWEIDEASNGFIIKLFSGDNDSTPIILIGGYGSKSIAGATYFLYQNWRSIQRRVGSCSFICHVRVEAGLPIYHSRQIYLRCLT